MDDDDKLTAEDQAALDSQRNAPEPEAPAQPPPEAPQEAAEGQEAPEGTEPAPEDDKRPQMVPHAALNQERKRRQEAERQAVEDRRRYEARLEEVLKLVPQPAAQETPQGPAIPDVQADPVGHIVGTMQQLGASQEQIKQAIAAQQTQAQQQQLVAAVQQRATAMEADYRAQNPEYDGAMTYLRTLRDRQLQAAGMSDPGRRAQQITAEAFQIAASALQEGGNPAERLHRMAEASGWSGTGGAVSPSAMNDAARQAQAPDQAARLRMVQQAQEQSRGLGQTRGNGPAPMTAQKLLDMDDDAFLKAIKDSKDARALLGTNTRQ